MNIGNVKIEWASKSDLDIVTPVVEVVSDVATKSAGTGVSVPHRDVLRHDSGMYVWQRDLDWANCDNAFDIHKAIRECPPISYLLFNKATAFINGNLKAVDITTEEVSTMRQAVNALKLMEQPNPIQNDVQFRVQYLMTVLAYGYCPVYKFEAVGFGTTRLYILPPHLTELDVNDKIKIGHDSQAEVWNSVTFGGVKLDKGKVFVFKDITPTNPDTGLPESRLRNMSMVITNITANYKARASIMANRGSLGMWVNQTGDGVGTSPMGKAERDAIQQDFKAHDLTQGDYNTIVSNLDYRWEAMTYPIKELMMTEQEVNDVQTLCDAIVYPFKLLAKGGETKYSDRGELKTELYQDTIIPESLNYAQQLRQCLELESLPIRLVYDFSHLPALQGDKLLAARTLKTLTSAIALQWELNFITFNQVLLALGHDSIGAKGEYRYFDTDDYKTKLENNISTSHKKRDGDNDGDNSESNDDSTD